MTLEERALARIIFRLKIHESKGQSFEDLFVSIFQRALPDFVPVKPQGSLGDRKNDGYDRSSGTYFQVYAPENLHLSAQEAVAKLANDFSGLQVFWQAIAPITSFHFVMNDRFMGTFPTIERDLAALRVNHRLQSCTSILARHLEDRLFDLSDDSIIGIIGFIPSAESISTVDYSVLNEVVRHIVEHNRSAETEEMLLAPDFSEKIRVNKLSSRTSGLLWAAGNQVGIFEAYFEKNSCFSKQLLRDHLNRIYQTSKVAEHPPGSDEFTKQDYIFMDVLDTATPRRTQEYINATLVVMGAFFESCDIFEEPGQCLLL
jgi:hypothetical protein